MDQRQTNNKHWILAAILILVAAFSRLLPHPYNFSPIAGMALLGGAVVKDKRLAFIIPLAALFISDLCFSLFTAVPGFYGSSQIINYAAFALIVLLGILLVKKINAKNVIIASLSASVLFFIISNFGTWVMAGGIPPYTADAAGLLDTYILGIPFFGNTLIGDLVYSGVLFGSYSLLQHYVFTTPKTVKLKVQSKS